MDEKIFLILALVLMVVAFVDWWILGVVAIFIFAIIFNGKIKKYRLKII